MFIDELKTRNDIVDVARELDRNLKKVGCAWQGTIRGEQTPALTIYPATQSWTHFAGDTTPRGKNGGDVIDLIEYAHQCLPKEAMEFLAKRCGMEMRPMSEEEQQHITEERARRAEDQNILEKLVSLFEQNQEHAIAYLEGRSIGTDVVKQYRIGWANHSMKDLRAVLHDCNSELVATVLSNQSFFQNSLIIPITRHGKIISFYSRSDDRQAKHMYLAGHPKGIFNHDEAVAAMDDRLYIAEAPIDALSAIQHRIRNIVAFGGCKLNEDQTGWLRRLRDTNLVACFDNDADQEKNRGYEATKALMAEFSSAKMKVLPPGDLNDFFQTHTRDDFEKLEERDWHTVLLQEIPADISKDKLIPALNPLFGALARMDSATTDLFIRYRLKEHFHLTARDVESCIRRLKEVRAQISEKQIEDKRKGERVGADQGQQKKELTQEEKLEAEAFLKNPNLIDAIRSDLTKLGIVGEDGNKVAVYLLCTTRKMQKPINSTVRASSGIGKSNLVFVVLSCMPPEDVVRFTRVTSKYLDYTGEYDLQYKILSIEERAGGEDADYSIRMIEDDTNPGIELGYLKKDPGTGEFVQVKRVVRGPTMLIQTTTKLEMNQENESREFPVYLDEGEEQRKDVQKFIKASELPHLALQEEERIAIRNQHQNAQRLLQPILVATPFSEFIEFPTKRARTSRDLKRLLAFIKVSALLHQYQRPRVAIFEKEYVVASLKDYEIAHTLLRDILEDALAELNPASQKLLDAAKKLQEGLGDDKGFTRADLRKELGWERTKIARAIEPLETTGYFDFDQAKKPFKYRVTIEDEMGDIAREVLPPEEFAKKVRENLDKIDSVYGNLWL